MTEQDVILPKEDVNTNTAWEKKENDTNSVATQHSKSFIKLWQLWLCLCQNFSNIDRIQGLYEIEPERYDISVAIQERVFDILLDWYIFLVPHRSKGAKIGIEKLGTCVIGMKFFL